MQPFEVEPPDKYKTGKAKRHYEKQCYKKAFDYMLDVNPEGRCVGLRYIYRLENRSFMGRTAR